MIIRACVQYVFFAACSRAPLSSSRFDRRDLHTTGRDLRSAPLQRCRGPWKCDAVRTSCYDDDDSHAYVEVACSVAELGASAVVNAILGKLVVCYKEAFAMCI